MHLRCSRFIWKLRIRCFLTDAISWHWSKTGRIYFKSGTYSSLSVTSVTLWSGILCIILYRMLQEKEVYIGQPSTCILVSHWLKHFKPAFYILNPSALIPCFVICGVRPVALTTAECGEYFMTGGGWALARQTLTWGLIYSDKKRQTGVESWDN